MRWRLSLLAASGLLPLAFMVVLALGYLVRDHQDATQQSALALSRALSTAIDAELRSTVAVLRAVSKNDELQSGHFQVFYRAAAKVALQQGWRAIVLNDAGGHALFRTDVPYGQEPRGSLDPESIAQAVALRRPVVGIVVTGTSGKLGFAVRVPISVNDVEYVLSAIVQNDQVLNLIKRQSVPPGWIVAVFDQSGHRVARSQENSNAQPSPGLQAMLEQHLPEGKGVTTTLEGTLSHTGYTRLVDSGWVVAVGIPDTEATRAAIGPMVAVLAGLMASLGLAAFLGRFFARKVIQPIGVLKQAASALGHGEEVRPQALHIAELDEVGTALVEASRQRQRFMQELRRGEVEREALLEQVTQALDAAQEAGRIKDEFLAVLGHELRNPLAPISMALQLMAIKGDPATAPERRIVERQLAHMTRLVDDLLDLSRITGKRLAMRREPVRIIETLQQSAEAIRSVLGGRRLRTDFGPGTQDAWVSGDEARLAQVFGNLLGNAVKFTSEQHGEIVLGAKLAAQRVEIEVRDNGMGMSPHVLEHAFEPFFQERQGEDRSRGGLGLGLAIVRSLVEMHGGSVAAASAGPGRGTCIRVQLPLAPAPLPRQQAAEAPHEHGSGKVLVVDDNRDAAETTAALLEISGYQARAAYDPESALALLDEFAPDVALLDIGLPGMSGYELARRVHAHPKGAACRLIALTGYGQSEDVELSRRCGFDVHLTKPASADLLLERVAELIDQRGEHVAR